jgi:hypothetical protein
MPNEPVEKVTFFNSASSAGSKIGNYFLTSKVFGPGNRACSQLLRKLCLMLQPDSSKFSFVPSAAPPHPSSCKRILMANGQHELKKLYLVFLPVGISFG